MGLPKSIDELDGAWLGQALHEAGRITDPAGVTIKRAEPGSFSRGGGQV